MNDLSFFRDSRVLITGGAGMIGSTIARILVEQGAEVTASTTTPTAWTPRACASPTPMGPASR